MRKLLTLLFTGISLISFAQDAAIPLQAENAALGSDYNTVTEDDITYVTPSTDFADTSFPATADKVMTFDVTFAAAGTYDLYARIRVGENGANDDSFYIGVGFGTKTVDLAEDWIIVNSISGGNSADEDYVTDDGAVGNELWKWINFSECSCTEGTTNFTVDAGGLTQTLQIGAREDGLDIDMIALGNADLYYTVSNLMNGENGVSDLPDPGKTDPIATGQTKFLGSAHSNNQSSRFDWHWNQVTPENGGKWGSVEGTQDAMNWGGLDNAYNEARDNDFYYKHHVLFWGSQQPTWMPDLSEAEQLVEINQWLDAIAERYPDIEMIEVVNEPLHDPPFAGGGNTGTTDYGGYGDALGGSGTTGWDWIIEAFTLARAKFPNALLMLNDYGILGSSTNITNYLEIINLLKAENLIDVVGVQGHAFTVNNMSAATITNSLDQLAAPGFPVYITELDIDGPGDNGEAIQLERYQEVLPAMWEHPNVEGITIWGYNPGHWREDEGATLVRDDGTLKPSMVWIRDYIEDNFVYTTGITITSPTSNIDQGLTLQMTATAAPEGISIPGVVWSVENGTGSAEINTDGLLTAGSAGTVDVIATAIDGSEVEGRKTVTINLVLGINGNRISLSVYPNPVVNGVLKFEHSEYIQSINLLDLEGRVIKSMNDLNQKGAEMKIDIKSGIYIVQISDLSGLHTRRVIVK